MNRDWLEGNWKELKGSAREKWSKLTDTDLDEIKGNRDKLMGKLQEQYGYAKLEAERAVDEFKSEVARLKKKHDT